ncbi:MAG: glutamate--tRNA ligase [Proteobacteria bacterium]|nr:glutamate--tRNA ligase [Pseudomonadota bacterium]NOG59049.1 glutamate--tRNA ligase [Pseudomonadota bacterium]
MMIKTRFAPSPTGLLHIGGIRTALFSWLYARHNNGKFVLRIEDTDRERSTDEAVQVILDGMEWLGLTHDEGPFYQTQRFDRYREVIQQLLESGNAYHCTCSKERVEQIRNQAMTNGKKPRYDGHCRSLNIDDSNTVIRFKNPIDGQVVVDDKVQGKVIFENSELDDLIIARSDGTPTYNLTVVVDDMDMEITDVIRGDDHLNNTPRQINILKALSAQIPNYAHIPMILGPDGKKLSKRDGAASILQYEDEGYMPEAVLNYLVRLGWSKGDQEIFSISEMVAEFDIKDVNKSASSLNPEKLIWLNQHYLKNADNRLLVLSLTEIFKKMDLTIEDGPELEALIDVQKHRTETLKDMAEQSVLFYQDFDEYAENAAKKHLRPVILEPLKALHDALKAIQDWNNANIKTAIEETAEKFEIKMGKLGQPLRVAVTGTGISPNIDDTLRLLGQEKSLFRLRKGIDFIENRSKS